jgi:hypothetical protein
MDELDAAMGQERGYQLRFVNVSGAVEYSFSPDTFHYSVRLPYRQSSVVFTPTLWRVIPGVSITVRILCRASPFARYKEHTRLEGV